MNDTRHGGNEGGRERETTERTPTRRAVTLVLVAGVIAAGIGVGPVGTASGASATPTASPTPEWPLKCAALGGCECGTDSPFVTFGGTAGDVNGNGEADFGDVTALFDRMGSIGDEPCHDYNDNGELDFGDVVALFNRL